MVGEYAQVLCDVYLLLVAIHKASEENGEDPQEFFTDLFLMLMSKDAPKSAMEADGFRRDVKNALAKALGMILTVEKGDMDCEERKLYS